MFKKNLKIWLLSSLVLATATDAMSAKISIPDITIERGETASVEVCLDNDGQPPFAYSGWQFDLFVPEGLSVEGFSLDNELSGQAFKLSVTDYGTGVYRMLAFTTSTGLASANMMSLTFRAGEAISEGELTIGMQNVIFSAPDGMDIDLDNSEAKVTVISNDEPTEPKAETPLQLLRKGDGTSHTFVCMMPLTNEELEQLGYSFVYGYTYRAHGLSQVVADTTLRYCHTPAEIYDDLALDFWVFAYYTDAEGKLRISSRRHLDGSVDDDFDPADYISKATKAAPDAEVTGIFTPDGRKVNGDLRSLGKGIFVVRTTAGSFKIMK